MHPDAVVAQTYFDYELEDIRSSIPNRTFVFDDTAFADTVIEVRRIGVKKKHILTINCTDILTCTIGVYV